MTTIHIGRIPRELADVVGAETDGDGNVQLPSISPNRLSLIKVVSPVLGVQLLSSREERTAAVKKVIGMKPVGFIKGQIIGLPGEQVDGITIQASTQNFQGDRSYRNASTITDKDGKYSFAFMEGNVSVWAELDKNSAWFLRHENSVYVRQNETVTLDMRMEKPVRVSGQVVAKVDRKPVAGVQVFVRSKVQSGLDWVTTDENGRFESRTLSGPIDAYSRGPWHIFPDQLKDVIVPDSNEVFQLPVLEAAERFADGAIH